MGDAAVIHEPASAAMPGAQFISIEPVRIGNGVSFEEQEHLRCMMSALYFMGGGFEGRHGAQLPLWLSFLPKAAERRGVRLAVQT